MNIKFAKQHSVQHSGKFPLLPLLPPLLLGALMGFSQIKPLVLADPQTMTAADSTASELRDPHFTRTWVITLRNQYQTADQYRQALQQKQTFPQRKSLEIRYSIAAREYNRMTREAPSVVFQTLSQPRILP